jgi:hypothetical protein
MIKADNRNNHNNVKALKPGTKYPMVYKTTKGIKNLISKTNIPTIPLPLIVSQSESLIILRLVKKQIRSC